ncbi:MAG: rhomboid family intramembrane serine protease [Gemmatales bacterium]|nr:rhomboid family intramembrane serine protease [Gemmatales bacterium]MDW7995153.1 rhomboid family intramembrane serine protease [Gemmatales bacterium]
MIPLWDNIPARRFPLAMWAFIALNTLVFLLEQTLKPAELERLFWLNGIVPAYTLRLIQEGSWPLLATEVVPLFTSMFLHGGWLHFLGNMWTLYLFGDNVEDRMGTARFAIFYLACGILAGVFHILAEPMSYVPAIGASGAISGVLGAYLLLYPYARVFTLVPIFIFPWLVELPAVIFIGFWYLTQVFEGVLAIAHEVAYQGVAWWAHIGGFLAGLTLTPFFVRRPHRPRFADEFRPW